MSSSMQIGSSTPRRRPLQPAGTSTEPAPFASPASTRRSTAGNDVTPLGDSAGGAISAVLGSNGDSISGQCASDESASAVPDRVIVFAGMFEYQLLESSGVTFGPFSWRSALRWNRQPTSSTSGTPERTELVGLRQEGRSFSF